MCVCICVCVRMVCLRECVCRCTACVWEVSVCADLRKGFGRNMKGAQERDWLRDRRRLGCRGCAGVRGGSQEPREGVGRATCPILQTWGGESWENKEWVNKKRGNSRREP